MNYVDQSHWKALQAFLPEQCRLNEPFLPSEEYWEYDGHRVHLDCFRNADAPAKIVLFHGVGTNGRQMSMILGKFLAEQSFETIAIDMPTYGLTEVNPHKTVRYPDWIATGNAYLNLEQTKDNRPIFVYGFLSAGGMLAYDVAAMNGKVKGVIGMTFLDQTNPMVRDCTSRTPLMGKLGVPLMPLAEKLGLGKLKMKMSLASKMWALCNDKGAMKVFMQDKTSAGNSATLAFLASYMHHKPFTPEQFAVCPILLTQPMADKWTPLSMSTPFLNRIQNVPVQIVELENGGHYPVEPVAIEQMHKAILGFITEQLKAE